MHLRGLGPAILVTALALPLLALAQSWSGPTGSPPNNNAATPINTGATTQAKSGVLDVNNMLEVGSLFVNGGNAIVAGLDGSNLRFFNFGTVSGDSGYGFRNNNGTMEFKNSGGSWTSFASGGNLTWLSSGNNIYNTNSGNVGINATSPAYRLDVNPNAADAISARIGPAAIGTMGHGASYAGFGHSSMASSNNYGFLQQSNGTTFVNTALGGSIRFREGNTDRMVVSGTNIGLGAFTPSIRLAIGDSDTGIQWHSDGNMGLYTNNSERMRLASNGNIGVGNTAPAQKLHVTGNVRADGFCIGTNCITTWNSGSIGGTGTTDRLPKFTAATTLGDSQIFDNGTNVGINTVSPAHKLTVQGPATSGVDAIRGNAGISNNATYGVMGTAGSYWGALGRGDGYSFVGNGHMYASGTAYANSFVYISDERLKENIASLSLGLDEILRLKPVTYSWREGAELAGEDDLGLIAQEVEKIVPRAVTTRPDGYKAIDYPRLIPILIKAMQEQQAEIEALRSEVEALKPH